MITVHDPVRSPAGAASGSGTVKVFMRPGFFSASGVKVRSPSTTASTGSPSPRPAAAAAIAFARLCSLSPHSVTGMSRTSSRRSGSAPSSRTVSAPSITVIARPPCVSDSRSAGDSASSENTNGRPGDPARMARTRGSSPFSTVQPDGLVTCVTIAFTSASWSTVSMPCCPRWSALTFVTTDTSLATTPMPLSSMPPRAVSRTPTCTPSAASTARPPAGPE